MDISTDRSVSRTDYYRFHPPLIRLQETAPNPLGRKILWTLASLIAFLFAWAMVGKLDIIAVADGRLVPASYLQIVQPAEAGIVREILVREGDRVEVGQVLMRMDTLALDTDLGALLNQLVRRQAEVTRIDAELAGDDSVKAVDGIPLAVMLEAQAQMQANRSAVIAAESEERARLAGAEQERAAALQQRTRLLAVLPIYRQQEGAFDRLVADGFAGELMASDKRRERIEREQELATQEHVIASAEASIKQSQEKLARIRADYHRGLHSERQVSQTEIERLEKEVTKHLHRQRLAELRAPHGGVIKELATSTLGTVVQPGTVLATLVPSDEHLKAEVWLSNQDVGFVYPGQSAKLKFTTFRFQKYGMAEGSVEHIGADAQSDDEGRDRGSANHAQAMRYKTLVSLDKPYLEQDGKVFSLAPGMQVSAEIFLGQRTVMEYLLSPIQKAWHEAARER